jgi:hypothetical protein
MRPPTSKTQKPVGAMLTKSPRDHAKATARSLRALITRFNMSSKLAKKLLSM